MQILDDAALDAGNTNIIIERCEDVAADKVSLSFVCYYHSKAQAMWHRHQIAMLGLGRILMI